MAHRGTILVAGTRPATLLNRKAGLAQAGYEVETASTEADFLAKALRLRPNVALIEGGLSDLDSARLSELLRAEPQTARVPIMLLNGDGSGAPTTIDDVVSLAATESILVARMQELVRLATMEEEAASRAATARQFGWQPPQAVEEEHEDQYRVLVVGASDETAKAMAAALGPRALIERRADPYLAAERLGESGSDAVVIALDDAAARDRQLYLCRRIRSNARYFNLPVLLLAEPDSFGSAVEPYRAGASIVLTLPPDAAILAGAIDRLVARQRRRHGLRRALTATLNTKTCDPLPGLYSAKFLRAHLKRLIADRFESRRSLSLLAIGLSNIPALRADRGDAAAIHVMNEAVDLLARLVRVEDSCARLTDIRLCVVLPDTDLVSAERAAERVGAVLSHTDFGLGSGSSETIQLWIETGCGELRPGDTVEDLIGRALIAAS